MPRRGDDNGSENQEGMVSFETLRDEGQHFVHVQQYHKAIESFTKALDMKPDDQHCLVTRSKCYLMVGNAESSLADAESALLQNKSLIKGLFQKAEALYQKGDFETALMYYHRGHRLRPELQEFRLGIQKSQEAINNSIGQPDSVKLEANKGDMSYFYKQEEEQKAKTKKQQRGAYQKPMAKKEEKKDRDAPKGTADQKTVKQLLGELYGDKEYLEKLLKDQSLTGKNNRNDMSREIKDKVCDGLEYLYARADFWLQQKPMYARKRDRDRQREKIRSNKDRNTMDKVLSNLEAVDEAQSCGQYQESLDKAKATLKMVEGASDEEIQNKPELIASLHSSIGNAYLELGKVNQAQDHHERDLQIAKDNDLEDARSRALDNLGRVYARKGDYEQAIEVWKEKIPSSKSALESTWLYHEIGRCYLELGKYSDARDYGEKSYAAAMEAEDEGWQLHASVLVAQSEVKLGDYQSASDSFEKSLEMAKKQNDAAAESAIRKALEEVNDKIVRGVKEGDQDEDGTDKYEADFETDRAAPVKEREPTPEAKPKPRTPSPPPAEPSDVPQSPPKPPVKSPERPKSVTIKETKEDEGESVAEEIPVETEVSSAEKEVEVDKEDAEADSPAADTPVAKETEYDTSAEDGAPTVTDTTNDLQTAEQDTTEDAELTVTDTSVAMETDHDTTAEDAEPTATDSFFYQEIDQDTSVAKDTALDTTTEDAEPTATDTSVDLLATDTSVDLLATDTSVDLLATDTSVDLRAEQDTTIEEAIHTATDAFFDQEPVQSTIYTVEDVAPTEATDQVDEKEEEPPKVLGEPDKDETEQTTTDQEREKSPEPPRKESPPPKKESPPPQKESDDEPATKDAE